MKYQIVEFTETKSVAVVPVNGVNSDQVKWNEKESPVLSRKGLFPKNKWKNYKIKIITSKVFYTYDKADESMDVTLSLNKTDIETDDISSATDIVHKRERSLSSSEDRFLHKQLNC